MLSSWFHITVVLKRHMASDLNRCGLSARLDANRTVAMTSSFNQRLHQHASAHLSSSCRSASTPALREDVTKTSYSGIPGGSTHSTAVVGVYHQSRAPNRDADWLTRRLPVSHVDGADRRHLQQLELGNNNCDPQKSPQNDSTAADGW